MRGLRRRIYPARTVASRLRPMFRMAAHGVPRSGRAPCDSKAAGMSADFVRQRAQREAARIASLGLNPFSLRAEIRRSGERLKVPYSLLLGEVMIAKYENARTLADA